MYLLGHWLAWSLVQYALTIRDSRLCRLRSDAVSSTNHVPLDGGTHLITMKPASTVDQHLVNGLLSVN
jgi:hypothetical protein